MYLGFVIPPDTNPHIGGPVESVDDGQIPTYGIGRVIELRANGVLRQKSGD